MKRVRDMVNIWPIVASAIRNIMDQGASTVTSAKKTTIAVHKGNVSICMEPFCRDDNATVTLDGLVQIAPKVSSQTLCRSTIRVSINKVVHFSLSTRNEYVRKCFIPIRIKFKRICLVKKSDFNLIYSVIMCFCVLFFAESPIKSKELDLSQYSTKQLSPDYRIHWRILKEKNEIEIVAVVNGTSWVGLGWRPRKLNATCRNFPLLQKASPSEQLVKASVSQNSKTPASEPEPTSEHASAEPNAEPKSPKPEPEKEPGTFFIQCLFYEVFWFYPHLMITRFNLII